MEKKKKPTDAEKLNTEWEKKKKVLKTKAKIEDEKEEILKKHKHRTFTKMLCIGLFLNCIAVEIFSGFLMVRQIDLAELAIRIGGFSFSIDMNPQTMMISGVVCATIAFAINSYKSTKENTEGGITYLNAQHEWEAKNG